jgi:hypothetical protein
MSKTITFRPKPARAEAWVRGAKPTDRETAAIAKTPMVRFTIDVPAELHRRVKAKCAQRGYKMADVICDLLEWEFPKA